MSENVSAPLLGSSQRPSSKHSRRSNESQEDTPLLSRSDNTPRYDGDDENEEGVLSPASSSLRSLQSRDRSASPKPGERRWPTVVAITALGTFMLAIICGVFFVPAAVESYAKEALVIEPTNLAIHKFTPTGVQARIQARFTLDASRVKNSGVRNIGRFGTWIARAVESEPSTAEVYLPEYGGLLLGTAALPRVVLDIRNGHTNIIDFIAEVQPGNTDGIRDVVNDWLKGRIDQVRLLGKATVSLKSGWIPLGTQSVSESLLFEGHNLPALPKYNITRLNVREVPVSSNGRRGVAADVSVSAFNSHPITLDIPPMGFEILVPACGADDPYIRLADAMTSMIHVEPNTEVKLEVEGIVRELPKTLLQTCPNSHSSPLDLFIGDYIHGNDTTVFVRGSNAPGGDSPEWISKLLSSFTIPVSVPGHTFDDAVKNFTLTDTRLGFPDPFAPPGNDDSNPHVSGNIVVLVALPKEMNLGMNVTRVRANADVFYKGDKLGVLNLRKWQNATSQRIDPGDQEEAIMRIESRIQNAPLNITDDDVFTDIIQTMLLGGKSIQLKIMALVDVEVSTVLGSFVIRDMPAEGIVPVKPISTGGGGFGDLKPKVTDLRIPSTGKTSLVLQATVSFTNPVPHSAHIPYINIHILSNGSLMGDTTMRNVTVRPGNNSNIVATATWDPATFSGETGRKIGAELLSQYISGFNTTVTLQTHAGTLPSRPDLGIALSKFTFDVSMPRLSIPNPDGSDSGPETDGKFIRDTTMHLLSSTAQFTLASPFKHNTMWIEGMNATALYNHTEVLGRINHVLPFKVLPGESQSPRLPVEWSFDGVGYEAVRRAIGGTLKVDAKGDVDVRIGEWRERVWYLGRGIGAHVRL